MRACQVTIAGADLSDWREVAAEGFTFCAPSRWKGSGHALRAGGASIKWGRGVRPPATRSTVLRVVIADPGAPSPGGQIPGSDVRRFQETIGGEEAELWRNRIEADYITGADWPKRHVWMSGEAQDARDADEQLMVYRTVRFVAQ